MNIYLVAVLAFFCATAYRYFTGGDWEFLAFITLLLRLNYSEPKR